jgi:hypothetical protein
MKQADQLYVIGDAVITKRAAIYAMESDKPDAFKTGKSTVTKIIREQTDRIQYYVDNQWHFSDDFLPFHEGPAYAIKVYMGRIMKAMKELTPPPLPEKEDNDT